MRDRFEIIEDALGSALERGEITREEYASAIEITKRMQLEEAAWINQLRWLPGDDEL